MRIFIDGSTICDEKGEVGAGIEHYTWSIIFSLLRVSSEHEFLLHVPAQLSPPRLRTLTEGVRNVRVIRSWGLNISFVSQHLLFPLRIAATRSDVFFSPFGQLPLFLHGKSVITVHDVSIYDHPEWFLELGEQKFSKQVVVPSSFKNATKIICVSDFTQKRLNSLFKESCGKTSVVFEGVEPMEISNEYSERFPFDKDFVLFLGTIEPRKNLANAFFAFHGFLESHPELASQVRFVVAGKLGWQTKQIEEIVAQVNNHWKEAEPNGVIQFLGPVTEEEKWTLLSRASCLLFPSLEEGFGLPVLEAMSVGTPVITTRCGAIPEIAGDAALYVEPDNIEQMNFALAQCFLVPEGIGEFKEIGLARAKEFTWESAAEKTLEVIESLN